MAFKPASTQTIIVRLHPLIDTSQGVVELEATNLFRMRTVARHQYYRSITWQNLLTLEADSPFNHHIKELKRTNLRKSVVGAKAY